ncbi:MAG TPA: hypothetical protein VGG12_01950 [Methylovirgula sp.]|jgi:hypothetical protein
MAADSSEEHSVTRAKVIGDGIKEVAAELRMINVADFISFIHCEQFGNIKDIINSSMELYFKHGTLSYGCAADYEIEWDRPPAIGLDMDFHHHQVAVSFNLTLRGDHAAVTIRSISFAEPARSAEEDTQQLIAAIADAKLLAA